MAAQIDLFGTPLAADRAPAATAPVDPLEPHISLTEALRRVGDLVGASRSTLYTTGVANELSKHREGRGWARTPDGGLRRCLYRVPVSAVAEVARLFLEGKIIPPKRAAA